MTLIEKITAEQIHEALSPTYQNFIPVNSLQLVSRLCSTSFWFKGQDDEGYIVNFTASLTKTGKLRKNSIEVKYNW